MGGGGHIRAWRHHQHLALQRVLSALDPLRAELEQFRSDTSRAVAATRDIAGLALFTSLLRWPDRTQAAGYLEGFRVVGTIETSKLFRPIPATPLEDDFSGEAAKAEVRHALRSPPPKFAEEIFRLTQDEIAKDFTEPLCSAQQLDQRYGVGQWRPIYRFLLHQGDKERLIDDGKRGGQNVWSSMAETISPLGWT